MLNLHWWKTEVIRQWFQECKNTLDMSDTIGYGSMGDGRAGDTNSGDDILDLQLHLCSFVDFNYSCQL